MKSALLPFLLALGACAAQLDKRGPPAQPAQTSGSARLNQPLQIGSLSVTPVNVIEDSRCPSDVTCVWAGRVVLVTRLKGKGWEEIANMSLGQPYQAHGQTIVLSSVQPARKSSAPVSREDYLFRFEQR